MTGAKTDRVVLGGEELGLPLAVLTGFSTIHETKPLNYHVHPVHEITYVARGAVSWELADGHTMRLAGGDMAITQPDVKHRGMLGVIEPSWLFWCQVDPARGRGGDVFGAEDLELLSRNLTVAGNRAVRTSDLLSSTLAHLRDLAPEFRAAPEKMGLQAALFRSLLCAVIARSAYLLAEGGEPRNPSPRVLRAVQFIEMHLESPLKVEDIAGYVGVGVSRLHELFREHIGLSPMDHVNRLRVQAAQRLLKDERMSITRVALETGFASSQYFATCFKRYTGMAPRVYRSTFGGATAATETVAGECQ